MHRMITERVIQRRLQVRGQYLATGFAQRREVILAHFRAFVAYVFIFGQKIVYKFLCPRTDSSGVTSRSRLFVR